MNTLAKKLFIKPNTNWLFYNVPPEKMELLSPLAEGVTASFEAPGSFDGILFFSSWRDEMVKQLVVLAPLIKTDTIAWVCYPKKSSKIPTDLAMMEWDMLAPFGVEVVAAVAFDEQWSCVRIRREGLAKKSGVCVDEIRDNAYGEYIDVDKKLINLPPDVQQVLEAEPTALINYNKLAYSHRKEYIMWILTAKQQKTRDARLVKMVEMLLGGKRNPSEK
ncbi:YdeI/OmpD-associated family protein [Mucilaginibacter sp. HMF5004]|uniref:YdeI/OmpD-associated family protein n=1 Tax=Mucilaginibacter rivuli TaxID=2857527 RepID=UPI001C5F4D8A|nr:YdeI/OmpD-associated family protein [Mucilaginibacter rivuli]MBW4889700.1 YdeI/OmpD-associated family protein [Mucilaginibacter rivuli]